MRSFMARALEPRTSTEPESGEMIDMIMRIVVLLPAPFGPRKPQSERSGISSEMPLTACTLPKRLVTRSIRTALPAGEALARGDGDWRTDMEASVSAAGGRTVALLSFLHGRQQSPGPSAARGVRPPSRGDQRAASIFAGGAIAPFSSVSTATLV